ncbi:hypothetical protein ACFV0H_36225 [Streptomyces erythrochromogenes]|uniref:Integral membrane protein n=1 Tax=Streptomyces erythrochromogenes TaxID=285574 RepID=A0ABZ1QDP8_9ACTN|nr:hypothetical protein [Streptomyces erythrochromogenes]MCX5585286.1 hypothetical protein [Streptomyces erythrochromogenes]
MSDDQRDQTPAEPAAADRAAATAASEPAVPAGPQPEPLRFFGTTWVDHEGGYGLRRAALAVGSLVTATAAAVLLRLSYEGLEIGNVGPFLSISVVVLFAIASAIAFVKTWDSFRRRPAPSSDEAALKGLKTIGFIGSLIAYSLRCLTEAPGEKLHRAEYERAQAEYARRRSTRTGNPAARRPKRKK